VAVVIVQWSDAPWIARLRRAALPLMAWLQERAVRVGQSRFALVAGVPAPARWEYDFVGPFWNALLLRAAVSRLRPRFVLGLEVHTHGLATALCRGCPRYLFPWGSDVFTVVETSRPMKALVRYALRKADLVLPSASSVAGYLSTRFGISRSRIKPLSWGVDRSAFRPLPPPEKAALRRRLGLPTATRVVVNGRRFLPQWQSGTVIEAFLDCAQRCPEVHLVLIAGVHGDMHVEVARKKVAAAGLAPRFTFSGGLSLQDYRDLLSAADVFVSMNPRFDMRSVSVLQGVACGLIPILSEHVEYREMQAAGFDAVFVPPENAAALSEALCLVLADLGGFAEMIRGNEKYLADHEDAETQMSRLLDLLVTDSARTVEGSRASPGGHPRQEARPDIEAD
jgi:glycosyltransferase involved in cell wall biosynthesis